ncbi:hypothetical protein JCM16163A_00030 [Paenibacillus sp. YK5]
MEADVSVGEDSCEEGFADEQPAANTMTETIRMNIGIKKFLNFIVFSPSFLDNWYDAKKSC